MGKAAGTWLGPVVSRHVSMAAACRRRLVDGTQNSACPPGQVSFCCIVLLLDSNRHGLKERMSSLLMDEVDNIHHMCRFPGADTLRTELEQLVLKHAQRPALHALPGAAALLATPAAASSGNGPLQALPHFATAPLLQASNQITLTSDIQGNALWRQCSG